MNRQHIAIGLAFVASLLICASDGIGAPCIRIISLAPSLTESVFALGLGARVVGVSSYDAYPDEVKAIRRVGGLLDPNLELVVMLKPDLVLGLAEQGATLKRIEALGITTLKLDHRSVDGVLRSLELIGSACDAAQMAQALVKRLEHEVALVAPPFPAKSVRTMVLIANSGASDLRALYVSGRDGFYSDLLRLVGAQNVFESPTGELSGVSAETLLALAPDLILVVGSPTSERTLDKASLLSALRAVPGLKAAREGRVYFLERDYDYIPGPRFVMLLRDLRQILIDSKAL